MSDDLPEGWAETTVGDVAAPLVSGFASGQKDVPGGLRHLRMNNISNECALDLSLVRTVPRDLRNESLLLRDGDSICCTTNSGKLVGKVALFDREGEWAFSNHLTRVRPRIGLVEARWLYLSLRKLWTHGDYEEFIKNWVNQAALPKDALAASEVRLAPLPEQRRIVASVEALLEQVKRAKGRLDLVPLILKRFRQAVLAAACSGELTKAWRELHPAAPESSFSHPNAIARDDTGSHDAHDLARPELPDVWRWERMDAVADFINGDRSKRYPNQAEYVASGLPFINTGHIEPDGSLSLARMNYISREKWMSLTGGKIHKGDLVYCLRGATLGKTALVDPFTEGAIASSLVIIRPSKRVLRKYLYLFLVSPPGREEIRNYDNGSAQPNLSAQSVGQYLVPLPPLDEQAEIVRQVEKLFALADTIERRVKTATARANRLPQAILSKAFSGELVPTEADLARAEGRTYETAEELLKRVTASGAAPAKAPQRRSRAAKREIT